MFSPLVVTGSHRFDSNAVSLPPSLTRPEDAAETPPKPQPLRRIREAAGPSVKSALSHTFTRDTRDDPFASTRGSFLKLKQVGLGSSQSRVHDIGKFVS